MTNAPFTGIILSALLIGALALAVGLTVTDTATTYNVTINSTTFNNISAAGRSMTSITNETANNFFGNKTSTAQATSIDRMIGAAYSSILVLGEIPNVFINIVESVTSNIGLSGYSEFIIAGILAIIVGIALYLAVGRN